ncbi:MAG TPA: SRPBCC domain-containing protein, partial [Mycobacteriales bacterium]|nr:SRPBCC domain-containing protein [Mycobacteriales bacterium]
MSNGVVSVSKRIAAPAGRIFELLADPDRHTEFDGSGMLRGADGASRLSAAGDRFVMKMYFEGMGGDYAMDNHVVEYDAPHRIAWTPSAADERVTSRAGGEVGVPAGHRWSFDLQPDGP